MATRNDRMAGLTPSVNDITSVLVLVVVYWMRIAAANTAGVRLPWWTLVVTDFFVPVLAACWLWVAALLVVYRGTGDV
jgi:hypothetical protein